MATPARGAGYGRRSDAALKATVKRMEDKLVQAIAENAPPGRIRSLHGAITHVKAQTRGGAERGEEVAYRSSAETLSEYSKARK